MVIVIAAAAIFGTVLTSILLLFGYSVVVTLALAPVVGSMSAVLAAGLNYRRHLPEAPRVPAVKNAHDHEVGAALAPASPQ